LHSRVRRFHVRRGFEDVNWRVNQASSMTGGSGSVTEDAQTPRLACGHEQASGFAALRRHSGLLVRVIGVARRATRLLHLLINHGDHDMIGDAALTRTIVVQNVTEPEPALLH
jgi:hypothetical protein